MSIANGHTLRPWQMGIVAEWNGHADGYATDIYEGDTEKIVATAFDDDVIARSNAHRIVAAHDLMAALELLQGSNGCFGGCYGIHDWRHSGDCATARAAIAKARGQNV